MPKIIIVGLGPWEKGHLTEKAIAALANNPIVFRTGKHPAAKAYISRGAKTLDGLYDTAEDFTELNNAIAAELLRLADEDQQVVYAVPGQGLSGDSTVTGLIRAAAGKYGLELIPGVEEAAPFMQKCMVKAGTIAETCAVVPAGLLESCRIDRSQPLAVTQIDSRLTAGQVKLRLLSLYGNEALAYITIKGEIQQIRLEDLDRQKGYNHRSMLWIPSAVAGAARYDLEDIVAIMERLRGPGGCPWDREQTHESLEQYLLEETYETIDAIRQGDMTELCEELGDVLLQVLFHARIAAERGDFDIVDVTDAVSRKMILRHPHIFGNVKADTAAQVTENWDAIKKVEKGQNTETGMMKRVPQAMPAVLRSMKVQGKAARVGFDWNDVWGAYGKLEEEVLELKEAIAQNLGEAKLADEFGDVLFAAVNVARFINVHPEFALEGTVQKFIRRFEHVERRAAECNRTLQSMSLAEMDAFWNEAKALESPQLT